MFLSVSAADQKRFRKRTNPTHSLSVLARLLRCGRRYERCDIGNTTKNQRERGKGERETQTNESSATKTAPCSTFLVVALWQNNCLAATIKLLIYSIFMSELLRSAAFWPLEYFFLGFTYFTRHWRPAFLVRPWIVCLCTFFFVVSVALGSSFTVRPFIVTAKRVQHHFDWHFYCNHICLRKSISKETSRSQARYRKTDRRSEKRFENTLKRQKNLSPIYDFSHFHFSALFMLARHNLFINTSPISHSTPKRVRFLLGTERSWAFKLSLGTVSLYLTILIRRMRGG